jgi:hypothetical protein
MGRISFIEYLGYSMQNMSLQTQRLGMCDGASCFQIVSISNCGKSQIEFTERYGRSCWDYGGFVTELSKASDRIKASGKPRWAYRLLSYQLGTMNVGLGTSHYEPIIRHSSTSRPSATKRGGMVIESLRRRHVDGSRNSSNDVNSAETVGIHHKVLVGPP